MTQIIESATERMIAAMAQSLRQSQANGELRTDIDSDHVARLILMTQQGLTMVSRINQGHHHGDVLEALFALLSPQSDVVQNTS